MANKIYRAVETTLSFRDSGGDAVLSLLNLGFGVGRVSARYDRGAENNVISVLDKRAEYRNKKGG